MISSLGEEGFENSNDQGCNILIEVKKQIAGMQKHINIGRQNKHIVGTHEYEQYAKSQRDKGEYGPSRLNGDHDFAQMLVDRHAGMGNPRMKGDRWLNQEVVDTGIVVGVVVNNKNGMEQHTTRIKIHYGKEGVHVVPHYSARGETKK